MISGVMKKLSVLRRVARLIRIDAATLAFIRHNRTLWESESPVSDKREVLFEFGALSTALISYSYLANVLSRIHDAKIKAFIPAEQGLARILPTVAHKVFRSFNTTEIFSVELTAELEAERDSILSRIPIGELSKVDLVDLVVDGVHIGDLVYDDHLRQHSVPTVDVRSSSFPQTMKECVGTFVFWRRYLDTHNVCAVNVSHCVYHYGIILRLAVARDIPVYQINATHGYRLSREIPWAYDEFYTYPAEFAKLSPEVQAAGLAEAEKRLARRFGGEVGVDMAYSTKSAYGQGNANRVIMESPRTKVFVALHCFFDNPHPYGIGYFADFHEWLTYLGEISKETDYDWYLKTHPDFLPGNMEVIQGLLKRYEKFTLIPSDTSHHQIVSEGIDVALTVHGTIGFEYAALGIPVVNASPCNPHIAYNFNLHSHSLEEYRTILMDLPSIDLKINIEEVYEYYYMRSIRGMDDWLLGDYQNFLDRVGGYSSQFTSRAYEEFLQGFTDARHHLVLKSLRNFVDSEEYAFQHHHLPSCDRFAS
mgnify:CR=1 FL=1